MGSTISSPDPDGLTKKSPNLANIRRAPPRWQPESFLTRSIFDPADTRGDRLTGSALLSPKQVDELFGLVQPLVVALAEPSAEADPHALARQIIGDPSSALDLVRRSAVGEEARAGLSRNVGRANRGGGVLRAAYGLQDQRPWIDTRLLVCLAADIAFADFAAGFWEVTKAGRTDIRIDLRSACNLVWSWANVEFRPLAAALKQALTPAGTNEPLAFGPIADLFERVLSMHPGAPGSTPDRARFLSTLAVERFDAGGPARPSERYLFAPAMEGLRAHPSPEIALDVDLPPVSHRERLALAVMPLFRELRQGDDLAGAISFLDQTRLAIDQATRVADLD